MLQGFTWNRRTTIHWSFKYNQKLGLSQSHTKKSIHISVSVNKTVRTETVIPEGDETIVDNAEDAKKFYQQYQIKAGKIVIL